MQCRFCGEQWEKQLALPLLLCLVSMPGLLFCSRIQMKQRYISRAGRLPSPGRTAVDWLQRNVKEWKTPAAVSMKNRTIVCALPPANQLEATCTIFTRVAHEIPDMPVLIQSQPEIVYQAYVRLNLSHERIYIWPFISQIESRLCSFSSASSCRGGIRSLICARIRGWDAAKQLRKANG